MSRLRSVFRDELFVRQAKGVIPTPVADLIYGRLRGALGAVRDSVAETRVFDPKTSERRFFVGISHPLGPMIAVRICASGSPRRAEASKSPSAPDRGRSRSSGRCSKDASTRPSTGSCPSAAGSASSRSSRTRSSRWRGSGHPALRRTPSISELKKGAFVALRPRIEGDEHPVAGIQEWRRLGLNYVLEVSEFLEVFMVAGQSDLFGLIPRSMTKFAHDAFGLRPLRAGPKGTVPIKLVWHASRDADAAHAFLREQIELASNDVVPRRLR